MRIAVVAGKFPAPSEVFVLDQVTALLRLGHDVSIISSRRGTGPQHEDVARYHLAEKSIYRPKRWTVDAARRLARASTNRPGVLLRSLNALRFGGDAASLRLMHASVPWIECPPVDAVVCHFGPNGEVATKLRALGAFDAPIATYFHGSDVFLSSPDKYRRLIREGDLLLTISDKFRQQLIDWGAREDRVSTEKMGVDFDKFPFEPRVPSAEGPVRLLTVARMVPFKGLKYAVEAISRLPGDVAARLHYDIIGDGPLRPEIEQRIDELGLQDRITLHGATTHEDVRRAFDQTHLFLLPSIVTESGSAEGMGVVLMEAMARGVPAMGTPTGGIPELVKHEQTGWVVEQKDPQSIADRITRLVRDPSGLEPILERAREKVQRDHDMLAQAERLVERFSQLRS